ncbi:GNAT family N-acetyltransferase [Sutcliffiella rhizosphaerae]|uniref:N-acetyltransferase domain-containing protein n=1 Tax=Sutcliffiella rhizosphaerae TaxID=2880967 RepID=A0ABN8ABY3_9BACI|nr:GNAT family N-acetyltransferase [Sutcliffiella rhizosphaerae]CAG9621557.1 hypothetical protein BACCIP111883_02330 [Sutcliffiella rhizosphaerae]
MIIELDKNEFIKCSSLLPSDGQMEAKAIAAGVNPGRIFVDDQQSPTTGLIWLGNNDGFIFIGDETNDKFTNQLNDFVDKFILIEAKKVGLEWFEGIGIHGKWDPMIERVFAYRELNSWKQRVYTIAAECFNKDTLPHNFEGYQTKRISKQLFDSEEINTNLLDTHIDEYWPTIQDFFDKGIGYCSIYNNVVVAYCFSSFIFENVHCIDIKTAENHRGKKIAQNLAYFYVKECIQREITPYWDCMEQNKPSIAVAENIGFTHTRTYTGYEFPLK